MNTPKHRRHIGGALLAAAVTAIALGVPAPAALATPGEQGYVVGIGGAIKPGNAPSEAIIQRIVDLAAQHSGGETPRIAIITAASSVAPNATEAADGTEYDNATANGLYYADWFAAHGAETYPVPIDVNPGEDYPGDPYSADNAFSPEVAQMIRDSDAVYFGGGDQTNYVRSLFECTAPDQAAAAIYAYTSCTDTPAMAAIRAVVESGGVSAGTSAGLTIQQGPDMISGGDPYPSWRDGPVTGWFDNDDLAYVPAGGLGFFSEGLLDSHFARRDRQPRMIRLAVALGHDRSFGVEEKTALVVDRAARTGEVIGDLGVSLLDTSAASSDGTNVAGVRYSYLTAGSTIDFASGAMALAGDVTSAPGTGPDAAPTADIWGSYDCEGGIFGTLNLAQGFLRSGAARASGDTCDSPAESPRFRTTYNRDADTSWSDRDGFTNLAMTISEIPSFSVAAAATPAAPGASASFAEGSEAPITVTVTNTGGTALAEVALTPARDAGAGRAAEGVVLPGESVTLKTTHRVVLGAQEFSAEVTARAVDANGAELRITTEPVTTTVELQGTKAPGHETGNGSGSKPDTADPGTQSGPGSSAPLAATGAPTPLAAWALAGMLLSAGAAALWRRGIRSSRPAR